MFETEFLDLLDSELKCMCVYVCVCVYVYGDGPLSPPLPVSMPLLH